MVKVQVQQFGTGNRYSQAKSHQCHKSLKTKSPKVSMANSYLRRWRSYKGKSGRGGCRYGLQPQKMSLICNDDLASPNSNIAMPRRDSRKPWNASTNPHSYPFLIWISMISTTPLFRTNLPDHVSSPWFEQREIWLSQEATLSL